VRVALRCALRYAAHDNCWCFAATIDWKEPGMIELTVNVIAPAVANALSDATGQHFDRLPLTLSA
jgi:hypothetical protein